ncbi:hypothetical protein W911_01095 [Hyphomicrobium nitrativorans NL23]|uniref:Uncharacterized protein n=1 Tax=Hyphomicrobium nitrativorans NL23 TaxID=1029756 RepID=V5SIE0_9HYPH|nr:hypothetical protein W911_01095 [Hyphomicrobium nitrativorans NL23]
MVPLAIAPNTAAALKTEVVVVFTMLVPPTQWFVIGIWREP